MKGYELLSPVGLPRGPLRVQGLGFKVWGLRIKHGIRGDGLI